MVQNYVPSSGRHRVDWERVCLLPSGRAVILEAETGQPVVMNTSAVSFLKHLGLPDQNFRSACLVLHKKYGNSLATLEAEMASLIDQLTRMKVVQCDLTASVGGR